MAARKSGRTYPEQVGEIVEMARARGMGSGRKRRWRGRLEEYHSPPLAAAPHIADLALRLQGLKSPNRRSTQTTNTPVEIAEPRDPR